MWEDRLELLEAEFARGETNLFCGHAFISFETEDIKDRILAHNKINQYRRLL